MAEETVDVAGEKGIAKRGAHSEMSRIAVEPRSHRRYNLVTVGWLVLGEATHAKAVDDEKVRRGVLEGSG